MPRVSALGHKRTFAAQIPMSALPPKNRTCAVQLGMSALGQKRTLMLFDHLVSYRLNLPRNREAERLGGFEIDH
jgi:hypothetical protein